MVTPVRLVFWVIAGRPMFLAALVGLALGVAAGEVTIPWLIQQGIDIALGEADAGQLHHVGMLMVGVIVALYVLHCLLLRVEAWLVYEGSFRLRQRLYTHVLLQPLSFFTKARSGELVHRVINDTSVFEDNAVYLFSDLPFEIFTIIGVLALMAITDWGLALVVVVFLAVAAVISAYVGRPLPTLRKSIQSVSATLSSRLQETLTGIRTVKAFGGERGEITRLDAENRRVMQLEVREGRLEGFLVPVFDLMELLGVVIVVWYGAYLIIEGRLTPGGLVAFMAYMEILAGPVSRAGKFYRHFQQCRGVSGRLSAFLSEGTPELPPARRPAQDLPPAPWEVAFDYVRFVYPEASHPAIDDLTLRIAPGDVVAIVGKNGAGKSTLMDVLLGFHRPTSGRVVIAGRDLAVWDVEAWRHAVGTMPQDVFLFHASISENIGYGRLDATAAEIEQSAIEAGLGSLISRLPAGLDTVVGDRGSRLSGGERQRIALARLFLKSPNVLVLDEPTSHLDGEAIAAIGEAVTRLAVGRTTFIVAHRPETIRLAQRVIVLDAGRIVGDGRHEKLLATLPLYRTLLAGRQPSDERGSRAKPPKPVVV